MSWNVPERPAVNPAWVRFYVEPPEKKTVDQCESHGRDHAAYRWTPQVDPRWSDEQKTAYSRGYPGLCLRCDLGLPNGRCSCV